TRQDDDVARLLRSDGINILVNRVGCALIPLIADPLHWRKDFDELSQFARDDVPPFTHVAVQRQRLVLSEEINVAQVRVDAVREGDIDNAVNPAEGHGRFGAVASERIQAFARSSGQQDSQSVFHRSTMMSSPCPAFAKLSLSVP